MDQIDSNPDDTDTDTALTQARERRRNRPTPVAEVLAAQAQEQWTDDGRVQDLAPGVAPGLSHPQVALLKAVLQDQGFGAFPEEHLNEYDGAVEGAVARFHEQQPRYKTYGLARDTQIKPEGFFALQRRCGRR